MLDGKDIHSHKVAICTIPRTGNTLLRKYFERITGIVTGSEMTTDLTMSLWMGGLLGEEITDDRVWIVKSHYPYPSTAGYKPVTCNKIIACVRNPLDTICSWVSLINTFTHDKEILDFHD